MKSFFGIFVLLVLVNSCRKGEDKVMVSTPISDSVWYPVDSGRWWVYQVDSTIYQKSSVDSVVKIVSTTSFLKEEIGGKIADFSDGTSYYLKVYFKNNSQDPWQFLRLNSIRTSGLQMVKTESDLNFIKLIFPIKNASQWAGNKNIDIDANTQFLENWNYIYSNLNTPFLVNSLSFDSTVRVDQMNDENLISKIYAYEIYAKNVGMISTEIQNLSKQNTSNTWDNPENGFKMKKSLINYKK